MIRPELIIIRNSQIINVANLLLLILVPMQDSKTVMLSAIQMPSFSALQIVFIYDFLFSDNLLPSSIPPPLNPHHRQVDDCVACDEEVLIEGVLDVEKSTINQQRGQANAEDRLGRRGRKGSGKATRG